MFDLVEFEDDIGEVEIRFGEKMSDVFLAIDVFIKSIFRRLTMFSLK